MCLDRTIATPANMKAFAEAHPRRRCLAFDTCTGETFSATAGDYWWLPDGDFLTSTEDHLTPLILVVESEMPTYRDAVTGELIG